MSKAKLARSLLGDIAPKVAAPIAGGGLMFPSEDAEAGVKLRLLVDAADAYKTLRKQIAQGRQKGLSPQRVAEKFIHDRKITNYDGKFPRDPTGFNGYALQTDGEMVPEIKPLNRQISMDIPAKEFAEKAAKMAGNNNTIGLGAKIMGGSNLAKGLLMMVADNPANKARVARYVHRAQNDPIVNRAAPMQNGLRNLLQFEGRQGEYVAELLREEEERRRLEEMGIF